MNSITTGPFIVMRPFLLVDLNKRTVGIVLSAFSVLYQSRSLLWIVSYHFRSCICILIWQRIYCLIFSSFLVCCSYLVLHNSTCFLLSGKIVKSSDQWRSKGQLFKVWWALSVRRGQRSQIPRSYSARLSKEVMKPWQVSVIQLVLGWACIKCHNSVRRGIPLH